MFLPQLERGDVREDGYIFQKYRNINGRIQAVFMSPKSHFRERINDTLGNARARAKENNLNFDIDVDYLISIYPEDNKCPVFGVEMCFAIGKGCPQTNSPSLDRIFPALGYIKGNVIWVSNLANTIKTNATPDQIRKVADFYEELYSQE